MRVLGLDYGEKTIGVAVSCENRRIAFALEVIRRENESSLKKSIARLSQIIEEYRVDTIVLGYPLNLSGTESFRCALVDSFKERLNRNFKRVKVILFDERLSTAASLNAYHQSKGNDKDSVIDKIAATVILQNYLEKINGDSAPY